MKTFKIKKGKHYSQGINFGFTLKKHISFRCKFGKSCLYQFNDVDKYDINKLYGFSTTIFHHKQSARVGWRCLDGENIQLLTYSYNDGVRDIDDEKILGTVKPDEEFLITIFDCESTYHYTFVKIGELGEVDNFVVNQYDKKKKDWFIFHYFLYPYFGGNKTAPHDMEIYIKRYS